jgi:hypothetical protein
MQVSLEVPDLLLKACKRFPSDLELMAASCRAMAVLSGAGTAVASRLATGGGVDVVVRSRGLCRAFERTMRRGFLRKRTF